MSIQFKKEHEDMFNLIGEYTFKKQKYLIRIWCGSRGPQSPGAVTSVWRYTILAPSHFRAFLKIQRLNSNF